MALRDPQGKAHILPPGIPWAGHDLNRLCRCKPVPDEDDPNVILHQAIDLSPIQKPQEQAA